MSSSYSRDCHCSSCRIIALATRAGLNTQEIYDHLQSGEGASWFMQNRIPHALADNETVYSTMTNSRKNSLIIVRTAAEKLFLVPLVAMAEQIYQTVTVFSLAGPQWMTALWRPFLWEYSEDTVHQQTKIQKGVQHHALELQDLC